MATEELKVKFKVDASEVKSGADEAKNKVKSAAQQMEGDVKKASSSMSNSLKEISRSTDKIGQAASRATGDLKTMEGQLKSVSRQMSAMQMFNMGARGIGMLGGIASNVMKLRGDYGTADAIQGATKVGQGAFQGAAMGLAMGGPMGAAVGGLIGAGNALLEAAVEQKQAARELMKSSVKSIEDIEERYQTRTRQEEIARTAGARNFDSSAASQRIAEARQALQDAKNRQADIQDVLYGRRTGTIDTSALGGFPQGITSHTMQGNWMDATFRSNLVKKLEDAYFGDENSFGGILGRGLSILPGAVDPEEFVANQYKLFEQEARNAEQEVQRAQQLLQELAPLQARIYQEQQKSAQAWIDSQSEFWNGEGGKAFDRYQNGDDIRDQIKEKEKTISSLQSQLQGVISRPAQSPTDALTRIGGGRGYASYNNSTAAIQQRIENNLRTLINNQKSQIEELNRNLEDIKNGIRERDPFAVWGS